jgi:RimJ/RimL family protein N-acetyltransferase
MSDEQPIVNFVGERVALGPLRTDLLPLDQHWMNDLVTQSLLGLTPQPRTLEGQRARYTRLSGGVDSELFLVYERASWRPLGTTGLHDIDERNGTAEFGIMLGAEGRGRGYGTEATLLTLDYAFTARGLRNVQLRAAACNSAALRVYHKAGFREIGRRRESHQHGGRLWDTVYMQALARDFSSLALARVCVPDEPRVPCTGGATRNLRGVG